MYNHFRYRSYFANYLKNVVAICFCYMYDARTSLTIFMQTSLYLRERHYSIANSLSGGAESSQELLFFLLFL